MDGTFVAQFAEEMSRPSALEVDGKTRVLLPNGWNDATPKQPIASAVVVSTLTGFIGYVQANVDGLPLSECLVHVVSPDCVRLLGKLEGESAQFRRQVYLEANTGLVGRGFPFGQYLDAESFIVGLQTGFVPTGSRDELLALVSSIKESAVRETVDNGVSQQQVTVAGGVTLVGSARVPNPITLQPFRTFREVSQPSSLFVVRLKTSPKDGEKPLEAILEADGGAWKLEAVGNIAVYLDKLPVPVIA